MGRNGEREKGGWGEAERGRWGDEGMGRNIIKTLSYRQIAITLIDHILNAESDHIGKD
jgi:hypothetical protein